MFVCLFVWAVAKQSKAQLTNYKPSQLKGYVLLEYDDFSNCETWEILIKERIYNDEGNYTEEVIFEQSIAGIDYYRLPASIMNDSSSFITMTLNTYGAGGNIIETEDVFLNNMRPLPPGGPIYASNYYEWICNGYQYSYAIRANMEKDNNGNITNIGYLHVDNYLNSADPHFYIYYPHAEWENMVDNNNQLLINRHGLSSINYPTSNLNYTGTNLVKLNYADASDELRNWQGHVITTANHSALVGVRKDKGPWRSPPCPYLQTDPFSPVEGDSYWDMIDAVNEFNQNVEPDYDYYSFPVQELDCIGEGYYDPNVDDDPEDGMWMAELIEFTSPEFDWPMDPPDTTNNSDSSLFEIYDIIDDIGEDQNNVSDNSFTWPNNVTDIRLTKVNDSGQEIAEFFRDSIIDEQGNLQLPSFFIDEGLYSLVFNFDDRSHNYLIIDVNERVFNNINISSFYNISAYPVPITENTFQIEINANVTDDILYQIYDNAGELYHEQGIFHDASENNTHSYYIEPIEELPEGNLINKFTFSDNSTLSFQTYK